MLCCYIEICHTSTEILIISWSINFLNHEHCHTSNEILTISSAINGSRNVQIGVWCSGAKKCPQMIEIGHFCPCFFPEQWGTNLGFLQALKELIGGGQKVYTALAALNPPMKNQYNFKCFLSHVNNCYKTHVFLPLSVSRSTTIIISNEFLSHVKTCYKKQTFSCRSLSACQKRIGLQWF